MDTRETANQTKKNIEAIYPLSAMQQGMLFHSLYDNDTSAYHEQFSCTLRGTLNIDAFTRAWQIVAQRQSILRTSFVWKRLDKMLQVVQKEVTIPVVQLDWSDSTSDEQQTKLESYLAVDRAQGFDLSKPPLVRLAIMRIAADAHYLVWSHHHAILDGWSVPLLLREVLAYYDAVSKGQSLQMKPAKPYREYINWLQKIDLSSAEEYWRKTLQSFTAPTKLGVDGLLFTDQINNLQETQRKERLEKEIKLSKEFTTKLGDMARRQRLTLGTIFQAAWAILLSRYSGESDVVFGSTVSGRPPALPGSEMMIGLFINSIPVRVSLSTDELLVDWLQKLQKQLVESRQFEHSSLVQIQEWSEVPRGFPLFESLVVFENYPVDETLQKSLGDDSQLRIENVQSFEQTNYPLTVVSGPGERLGVKISYDPGRFDDLTIERMLGHLQTILEGMVINCDAPGYEKRKLGDLELLTIPEKELLLDEWLSNTIVDPKELPANWEEYTIDKLFEEQARRNPDAPAVIFDDTHILGSTHQQSGLRDLLSAGEKDDSFNLITYHDLNLQADKLASFLNQLGIGKETFVGIYLDRSIEMITGIFGVLKAGGAYVPMDINYPWERVGYMIRDTKMPVILTQSHLVSQLKEIIATLDGLGNNIALIPLDTDWEETYSPAAGEKTGLQQAEVDRMAKDPKNLAYLIYTSGSTGTPKAVMVEHRSLVNHALNFSRVTNIKSSDRILQFLSLGFDASGEEIFPTLINGACLVIPHNTRELTTEDFCRLVDRYSVTILHLPVAYWHQCVDEIVDQNLPIPNSIRILVVGGESPSVEKLQTWNEKLMRDRSDLTDGDDFIFINAYGPTEATIAATYLKVVLHHSVNNSPNNILRYTRLPIGKPIANVQVYVVDSADKPVPVGVPGEIIIGGAGVARGYLNRPELTDEKFIQNRFPKPEKRNLFWGDRLYRTGDMGRFLLDGNIEFLGRVDQQVKLRGFRIELGEIEACLAQHASVESCVVLLREDIPGNKYLAAYVVPSSDQEPVELKNILREHLQKMLPDYMIPSTLLVMDAFPMTPTGKIDRRSLPAPDPSLVQAENAYVAPRNDLEKLIAGVWEQVLNISRVGAFDNFFTLGGHSLLATQVISRLRNVFNKDIPIRYLFETAHVAELALRIELLLKEEQGLIDASTYQIVPIDRDLATGLPLENPELSFSQQRLWFLDQLAPGNLFYNIPLAVEIRGNLKTTALVQTLNEIIRRHAVLRTNFKGISGKPVQIIHPKLELDVPVEDLTYLSEDLRYQEALRLARQEARFPFNLEKDPLIRARLLLLDQDRYVFLLNMHHIISDGWSMGIFMRELANLYPIFSTGKGTILAELKIQYFDFAHWQRSWMQGDQLERQLNYWRKQLQNQPRLLNLPTDHPRPAVQSSQGKTIAFSLPKELSDRLLEISRNEGVTLFMTLLAAFQALLSRYSGQDDISVGTAIANRNRAEIEPLIGFFVNTLVMRTDLSGNPSFKDLLKRVREVTLGAYAHQDLPFEMLVEELQPQRDLSHTPLFQVAFALQNAPTSDVIGALGRSKDAELEFNLIEVDSGSSKFDMTLTLAETRYGLQGGLEYNTDLFEEDTILRIISHFQNLLESFSLNLDQPIANASLLSEQEKHMMLIEWNQTSIPTPIDRCAHELFEMHALETPDQIAAIFEDQQITYRELDVQADQLASFLIKLGIGPDVCVGISTDRSIEMVIGILGILKAGGAYIPLDPNYPPDRLVYMVKDSKIPVLLTQKHLGEKWITLSRSLEESTDVLIRNDSQVTEISPGNVTNSSNRTSITLDDNTRFPQLIYLDASKQSGGYLADEVDGREEFAKPVHRAEPDNLAYMIYTSGSTGRPKGTMLRHRGLCNLAEAQKLAFGIQRESRVLQFSPLSFDASVWETFMALANGATLVLARQDTLASASDLLELLKEKAVTIVTLPPSVLRLFKSGQVSIEALPALQTVVSAGEACTTEIVQIWAKGREFFNAYGPTETTVCASMYRCDPNEKVSPAIGHPIANTKLFILDRQLQPVPIGVPGELHVSGISLAAGYLNQPELTSQKFIPNELLPYLINHRDEFSGDTKTTDLNIRIESKPFDWESSFNRLYKTGDLARYRRDGNIEFLGRIDQQVKVRGFRIELGEIETSLARHPAVKEAVVIDQEHGNGDRRLVGFVVPESGVSIDVSDLRNFLRQSLPDYMVPAAILLQDSFPLTPSGKVDRKALSALDAFDRSTLKVDYVAPRNDLEEHLTLIVKELLHLEKVGIFDNFFELGGHSLLATQFVSRARDELQVEISLRQLFETPTIAGISEQISLEREIASRNREIGSQDTEPGDLERQTRAKAPGKTLDRARLAELLQRIGELSDAEVKELLEQKKALMKGDQQ